MASGASTKIVIRALIANLGIAVAKFAAAAVTGSSAMITEGGWNDHPRWTRAVRPGQRIDYTLRAYDYALHQWPWMEAVCFWAFRYPWDAKSYQDYFTFVRTDFEPKPIYQELQKYAAGELQVERISRE